MPLAKLCPDPAPDALPAGPRPSASLDRVGAHPSPVRTLQQQLERHAIEAAGPELERWSPRRSLALIVAASTALWMGILAALAGTVHVLA